MADQTIADYHASLAPNEQAICDVLNPIIDAALPDATSKIWHRMPVWFLKGNPIVGYGKLKDCIRLMFWSGASFETPGLSLGTGKFKDAHIRYTDPSQIDRAALDAWLTEARTTQWDYKNIVKRKGRLERLI